jgi:phage terminase large subunit
LADDCADFQFPAKFAPLLPAPDVEDAPWPHFEFIFLDGGRGGGKSRGLAGKAIAMMREHPHRFLCCREIQNSIADSVHKILKDEIERQGLGPEGTGEFVITKTEIRHRNGGEFLFRGLFSNLNSIKSMEGLTIIWGEEAQTFSQDSIDIMLPTLRRNAGAEFWVSYNPKHESDPISVFAESMRDNPNAFFATMTLEDNPWANAKLYEDRARDYANDPDRAAWIWGGKFYVMSDAQVLKGKYRVEAFEPQPTWDGPYYGLDFGFAQDPAHAVEAWIGGGRVWIRREAVAMPGTPWVEIDHLGGFIVDRIPGFNERDGWADSSRPENINYLQRHGFGKLYPCHKWPGSIEDGIAWLRGHDCVIIHPECPALAEEARLWSYKQDRITGEVLRQVVDKHNHGWDAVRYALDAAIRGEKHESHTPKLTFGATKTASPWGMR